MNGCRNRQLMNVMVGVDGRSLLFAFHFQGSKRSKVMKLSSFLVHLLSRTDDFHIARSSGHFLFETLSSLDFDHSLLVFLPAYVSSVFFAQCFSVFLTSRVGLKMWTAFFLCSHSLGGLIQAHNSEHQVYDDDPQICISIPNFSLVSRLEQLTMEYLPRYLTLHVQNVF